VVQRKWAKAAGERRDVGQCQLRENEPASTRSWPEKKREEKGCKKKRKRGECGDVGIPAQRSP
jgi:hypothetical protein